MRIALVLSFLRDECFVCRSGSTSHVPYQESGDTGRVQQPYLSWQDADIWLRRVEVRNIAGATAYRAPRFSGPFTTPFAHPNSFGPVPNRRVVYLSFSIHSIPSLTGVGIYVYVSFLEY
jgi:hypothetical protein